MTTTSRQAESSANAMLGALLQGMMRGATVRYENTQVIEGHPGLRPDIIITDSPQRAPVVVEAEYAPARSVEREAMDRLGLPVVGDTRVIEAAIALRYPEDLESASDIAEALKAARFEHCVHYKDGGRFPASGWLESGVSNLADLIRLVSVSQSEVDAAAAKLQEGIERVATIMDEMNAGAPGAIAAIAQRLGMVNVPQTRRMACAILANALVFQERIASIHQEVKRPRHVCGNNVANPQVETLDAWAEILKINYWPIFAIAMDLLEQIDPHNAARILNTLEFTAGEVNALGVTNSHDLTGQIFQRLISDRKYLATFYTLPTSAALLARIAVAKLSGVDWADADAIGKLRVADFACGTGTLLSAVYEQIANRHERAGGDAAALHKPMMEDILYGCDVMPSAIHITGATLSGVQPQEGFNLSRLYTMPYGRQPDGDAQIGSLELLQNEQLELASNTNDPALRTGSMGEETAAYTTTEFPSDGFDIVIMNPPFTRATNHEGAHRDVVNPAFAAFEASYEAQTDMGNRINAHGKGTCYHGNAGIASAFLALANLKLKPDGVLAFVLPLSAASGTSWQKFRRMLAREYTDLEVCSIAANGKDMSFSSDTGMSECLVIARKRRVDEKPMSDVKFTSLARRPAGFVEADLAAKYIIDVDGVRGIEDGPFGGAPLNAGTEQLGELIKVAVSGLKRGEGWGSVRVKDISVAQTAYALAQSQLWLPASANAVDLTVTRLADIGKRGPVDRLILGPPHPAPFTKAAATPTATYPCIWNHNAKNETRMICVPDSQLLARLGMESKATEVWANATRVHLNRDFTFGSQPLAVAFTEVESMGGRVWPNIQFSDERFDYAFTIWGNSTLGLLCYWWHSSRQQSSKANITVSAIDSLPVLDLRALTDVQLATAQEIFDEFRELELQPAYLADADANRALLDRRVVCDMLGFDDAVYEGVRMLAAKWCAEPSVHGGKRWPAGARLVV